MLGSLESNENSDSVEGRKFLHSLNRQVSFSSRSLFIVVTQY